MGHCIKQSIKRARCAAGLVVVLTLLLAQNASAVAPDAAVQRAHDVLKTARTGKDVLVLVHFGAEYKGHSYVQTCGVQNRPDDFALIYRYRWADGGVTDLAFLCDDTGSVYAVSVMKHNGELQQPWLLANAAINLVGQATIEACGDSLEPSQRAMLQRAINAADAKAILEVYLKCRLP